MRRVPSWAIKIAKRWPVVAFALKDHLGASDYRIWFRQNSTDEFILLTVIFKAVEQPCV